MLNKQTTFLTVIWLTLWPLILLACHSEASSLPPGPANTTGAYYTATGHSVQPPFWEFYQPRQDLLGYPISEAMTHEGWQVQYFQNGRLEVHPENEPAYFITVGWLGQLLNRQAAPNPKPPGEGLHFSASGQTVHGAFADFFSENGGTVQFGYPLGPPFVESVSGRVAQDFQSARLRWFPDLPPGEQVQLAPLGETYFLQSGLSLTLLEPVPPPPDLPLIPAEGRAWTESVALDLQFYAEKTARRGMWRVVVQVKPQSPGVQVDLAGYGLALAQGEQSRRFPPTNSGGETHLLLYEPQTRELTLHSPPGGSVWGRLTLPGE